MLCLFKWQRSINEAKCTFLPKCRRMKRPKLCDEHGYSYEWINGQKPHLIKHGIRTQCKTENFEPIVVHLQLLQARQPQRPRHLQVRELIIQITIQQSNQVKVWIDKLGETRSVRYTSLTTTISHDNNNHRTSKELAHGSPPCLGRGGWVPVKTHSTPVPTSVGRLWVAHQLHNTQQ